MPDLKAYLADKYMSGPKRDAILARTSDSSIKRKKRKPKNEDYIGGVKGEEGGGLMLRDEDEWRLKDEDEDMEDGDTPVMGKDVSTFQKSKSSWATVGSTSLPMIKSEPSNEAGPSSPPPSIKAEPNDFPANQPKKRKGGLRTAAQMAEEEAARKAAEKSPTPPPDAERSNQYNETVHRDASGRVIDVAKLKEEEKRQEEEAKRKELERKEWTKGLVQRQARDSRRKEEKEMGERKNVGVSRDDIRMNREMQEVDRWNDPAAEFLTKKKGPRRPKYEGPFAPNRFGIPPGFRWDGVDRSNGFEKKYFQAQNSAVRKEYEKNQWSVEDM